jgi:uncharacterized protein (DUF885 family)
MLLLLAALGAAGGGAAAAATAATASETLARLADEYWEGRLRADPLEATAIGDRRYDDRLPDNTPAGRARERERLQGLLARTQAVRETDLANRERVTLSALLTELQSDLTYHEVALDEWTVDPAFGPQVNLFRVASYQIVRTPAEGRALVTRWRAMGPYLDQVIANLRRGLAAGKTPVRASVEKAIGGMQEVLATAESEWALSSPATAEHADWSEADRKALRDGVTSAVHESVRPAYERLLAFLKTDALPAARPQEKPGIQHVGGGAEAYAKLIRVHTSLDLTAAEIHKTGLAEVARINGELEALGTKVLRTGDRKEILRRLRTDPALHFTTRAEVEAKAESALARARTAIPQWFGILPQAPCDVVPMEAHEEKNSTIAYYRQPATDGSRPGRYYINTYAPETRPRYEAEALAYHEAIPGHHLQIAIAQELRDLPEFRKHAGVTAYVEGWALYTERLSNEMGLYSGDLDRIGMLSFDAWRACRLVVDTGMHAQGWSRQQAIDYMIENTALAENNIENEVDRYIVWPGQALAYKTGQLEILRLRAEARQKLGDRFDIKAFHDTVLENGGVSLGTLRELVATWIERTGAK